MMQPMKITIKDEKMDELKNLIFMLIGKVEVLYKEVEELKKVSHKQETVETLLEKYKKLQPPPQFPPYIPPNQWASQGSIDLSKVRVC